MNRFRFSYYITTHFILRNKDYNFCRNLHLVYQTQPWYLSDIYIYIWEQTAEFYSKKVISLYKSKAAP